ncbi:MFS transporter [Melissococcus plutonius]|uniref:Lactose permease n=1 Tax=Melissococcus plutonius (strain ATCC 35311 / DSM 29964 / CIP 104052 / LMG 20360 / NCIMB 702443) TaxID=940190 RepID=F3YCZ2_MELPT|nr:MFS transporter [Melissococcus plutonius]KMT30091.1 lactose permease [Melissococcus plutonius]KMT31233.1 lactose permease [Melissococcus plutonius]KMT38193.1 lactose permease [Melissococcus plutonius]MBB5178228.1 OHS family lactose permease-like MFS transporter [Melissococcus plutonius]BAK22370.1 lactose permease [Melissococcus plutonius ATCC 35311]
MDNEENITTKKKNFWGFPLTHFTYFFIWQIIFGYLTLWMEQVGHLSGAQAGIVFSMMAGISLLFQPAFGIISDKFLFRKNLILMIGIAAILIGPYFQWIFLYLLNINATFTAIITGIFLSFILNGGVSVIEQYIQRASLAGDTSESLNLKQVSKIFTMKNFWFLAIFFIGTSAIYDVFDQQFIIFFKSFFDTATQGTNAYSYMTTIQIGLEFLLMFTMPWLINKIGSRNGLIAYGVILAVRIIGSALAPNLGWIISLRLLAGFEMPLFLVSVMKYITRAFDIRLYATIYTLASSFAKQISVFVFSSMVGSLYDSIGFHQTYLIMGIIIGIVTLFSAITLKKEDPIQYDEVETSV